MEGEQEPPLVGRSPTNPAGFQLRGDLLGELTADLTAAGPREEINGSPQAPF
jgi:hypothetical protein